MVKRKLDESMSMDNKQTKVLHGSFLCEQSALKYDFMTSLQNISMSKIVTHLWMLPSIQQEIQILFRSNIKRGRHEFSDRWKQTEKNVVAKLSQLSLAHSVTQRLISLVPLVGRSIINWVRYHDAYIFQTKSSAVDQIKNITWTGRAKIDFSQTAQNILASQDSGLTYDHKYKIACTYCLKKEIAAMAPNIVNKHYLHRIKMAVYPMVHYWTHIVKYDSELSHSHNYYFSFNQSRFVSMNENIFRLMLRNTDSETNRAFMDVPLKFIWNKLSSGEKARNITLLFEKLGNQDFAYSLLSSLKYDQQREIFRNFSAYILGFLFNHWLWGEYFLPTAFRVLDVMSPLSYFYILMEVNKEKIKNSQMENIHAYDRYKVMFKKLWQNGSQHAKEFIVACDKGRLLEELLLLSLSWQRDMDLIELILADLTTEQKKNIIFGDNGIERCVQLIESCEWDLLKLFIKSTLSGKEELDELKQILTKAKGTEIVVHFSEHKMFDEM